MAEWVSVLEYVLHMHKVLGLVPSTVKKKINPKSAEGIFKLILYLRVLLSGSDLLHSGGLCQYTHEFYNFMFHYN